MSGPGRLEYYAGSFDPVEVNATLYRVPFSGMITGWNRRLPPRFHPVVKGSRRITHLKKLTGCDEPLAVFLERVLPLKTLRVILWQLPPSLHRDLERLDGFLGMLPRLVRHAVEFRRAGRDVYAFFSNDYAARAPRNALQFLKLLRGGG